MLWQGEGLYRARSARVRHARLLLHPAGQYNMQPCELIGDQTTVRSMRVHATGQPPPACPGQAPSHVQNVQETANGPHSRVIHQLGTLLGALRSRSRGNTGVKQRGVPLWAGGRAWRLAVEVRMGHGAHGRHVHTQLTLAACLAISCGRVGYGERAGWQPLVSCQLLLRQVKEGWSHACLCTASPPCSAPCSPPLRRQRRSHLPRPPPGSAADARQHR